MFDRYLRLKDGVAQASLVLRWEVQASLSIKEEARAAVGGTAGRSAEGMLGSKGATMMGTREALGENPALRR